jgi:phosphoserine phosphatase
VESVVDPTSDQYLPPEERIVTTDMDGTFLCEKGPTYFDQCFSLWHALHDPTYEAPQDLKARSEAMIDEFYSGDITFEHGPELNYTLAEAYTGHEPEELASDVLCFAESVDVVGFSGMKYGESFYKPMLEVIDYLRANDFDVWVVSATERFLARAFTGKYAGFAPDHVIASDFFIHGEDQDTEDGLDYTLQQDEDLVISGREISENGKTNKCISILNQIGRRPILAFGNSSGDYAMLNYATSNPDHEGIGFLVLCDDTVREYGDLDRATKQEKEAEDNGWVTISMAKDWSTIYGEGVEKTEYPTSIEDIQALAALDEAA